MMKILRGFLLVSTILAAFPAAAQSANPLSDRENRVPPVVSWLQAKGVSLTYLGEEGGLRGYLGESANGKMQTFYVAPDGEHVIAGILFRTGGDNVTGVQIGEMRARFEAAASDLGSVTVGSMPAPVKPVTDKAPETVPDGKASEKPASESPAVPDPNSGKDDADGKPPAAPDGDGETGAPASGITLPEAVGPVEGAIGNPSELWISKIDKAEFLKAAEATPFFEVGTRNAPVTVWMVADPQCPFCHKAWDYLRKEVYSKAVKVRVILIAGLEGSEPLAKDMLSRPLPARAWLDSDAGTNLKLEVDQSSPEWEKAGEFLDMNMEFAKKFGVDRTPFLGYFAKDGRFYSALGLPSDLGSFFAAANLK